MEAGENPARSRHCNERALLKISHCKGEFKVKSLREGEQGVDSESGNMHDTGFGSQASEKRKVEFLFAKNSENGLWQGGIVTAFARSFLLPGKPE